MTHRDHFIARADADRHQGEMERRRAVGHGTRVRSTHVFGELSLERRHFGPLRHPTGQDDATNGFDFALVKNGLGERNLLDGLIHGYL